MKKVKYFIGGSVSRKQAPRAQTRDVKGKAKFGEVHRSPAKKGASERSGAERRRTDNDLRNATAVTSASVVAAPIFEHTETACPPSRADLPDPDAMP